MYNTFKYTVIKYDKRVCYSDDVLGTLEHKKVAIYKHCTFNEARKITKGYKDIDNHGYQFERKNSPYYFNVYVE